ncbi:phosphoinositide 3-kinase adapter protein 1 isoform X2 [Bufo bufo]|uniref:phosphoinositide 3-kinase adapter protein 1 isoform X2 n=1 Tax=Bufo bufo TaxID=8384 RepID=UPI001ABDA2BA|nr:phosphoinositide 3-kinase adapter protein 1 isoform X2 [Bufo bufo]
MASRGICDLLILHGPDASEWCQYLVSLFGTNHHVQHLDVESYKLCEDIPIPKKSMKTFRTCRCILFLLSGDIENTLDNSEVLESLRKVLRPPNKVIVLFCGVIDKDDFAIFFQDSSKWKTMSCEDDPELYITTVMDTISEDSGCGSVSDTDPESGKNQSAVPMTTGNLLTVQPERIRCGVNTQLYLIFKCKLDCRIKNEVLFAPKNGLSARVPATLQNEYMLSVDAPDLPSGLVFLKVFSGDLLLCEAKISYFTDMEEICNLLDSATNPIEFMCQAFKIMPYDRDVLDKTLTESLKNNIPASGLHLFGINQIEEENISANQRDEELPTLLHFSAKYGLKKLTALLLTCPGALQAYSVANKDGHFPNNIAEKYGYVDLRQFIDEYVETADMLRSHIKEELMYGEEDESIYEPMANLSTDILMKYMLQPDMELYLPMKGAESPHDTETYTEMLQISKDNIMSTETQSPQETDSALRRILEGSSLANYGDEDDDHSEGKGVYDTCLGESVYDIVCGGTQHSSAATTRPPVPFPRPEQLPDTEPYITQFTKSTRKENMYVESSIPSKGAGGSLRRDRQQSSVYDPFVGMKTPGQRELITLQERVKLGMITVDEAVLEFKEWQLNQKKRSDSFRYQQENLKKLRDSINRRRNEDKNLRKSTDLEITKPIRRGQNLEMKHDIGVYESTFCLLPPKKEIKRRNWKTDSTSSTASSASNRSSTRSTLSMSSGMEGDNEDNEVSEHPPPYKPRHSLPEETPPPRPPRIQTRSTRRSQRTSGYSNAPPVPPRGRNEK